jgi:thioredoxin reductase (NADPH)
MTSVKGLFAAGDVMDPIFRQVAVAVGNGTIAGMNVHKYLSTL